MRDKSDENWRVGQRCLQDGDLNAAASRLYYGVFQAVLAWARAKKRYVKTSDAHRDMYKFVCAEGEGRILYGRKFQEMRGLRETADYHPDTPDADELKELLPFCVTMRTTYLRKAETP
ncbi:MAG: HEPN domain-containing protein [Kiritimatiellaeota bacterium]|nr:HEPN domain-containing protein [Kiritimatiellota bacterium]